MDIKALNWLGTRLPGTPQSRRALKILREDPQARQILLALHASRPDEYVTPIYSDLRNQLPSGMTTDSVKRQLDRLADLGILDPDKEPNARVNIAADWYGVKGHRLRWLAARLK
ncbi:MAG: hypothetical protein AB7P76_05920 [Candidatus Melainabacteria bacterium]